MLLTKYCSVNNIEKNEIGGACRTNGERRGVHWVLLGETEGKRPLGRPRHRWEDNIELDLQEVGCGVWIGSNWLKIGTGGEHL